mmetsp:Transcript_10933/g.16669  ORF Transcript_10933/g.16669 Transcript_10933/m.16669 type:complete len:147 (+) Transcript_10933:99-539(+)
MLRRINKELEMCKTDDTMRNFGMQLEVSAPDTWLVHILCPPGCIYENESYTLRVVFGPNYPIESPEVVFIGSSPVHPHVYSNGHICLNILYDDWSPALTVQSICLSLVSMLYSATEKVRPPDNTSYTSVSRGSPKNTRFIFHDDTV